MPVLNVGLVAILPNPVVCRNTRCAHPPKGTIATVAK
jgi:hypothetical protein